MNVTDEDRAVHYLSHLNYYRLAAYWLPYESDHANHQFQVNTNFEDILNLYIFDRELRILVLDAIERLEVSIRTNWAHCLSQKHGSHAHINSSIFKDKWDHTNNIEHLKKSVKHSKETFIQHLTNKYEEELPPIWAIVEIMTFGQLSKWYSNIKSGSDRNEIANKYNLDEVILTSFLHHISTIRNVCAHHSRLWNREFTFTFKLPKRGPDSIIYSHNTENIRKIYNTLVMLAGLLDIISPDHHWKTRLYDLIQTHNINVTHMGFPANWQDLPIWK